MPKDTDKTVIMDDEDPRINRIGVRIPPFWPEEPELWFAQLKGQLALAQITDDDIKFAHVL